MKRLHEDGGDFQAFGILAPGSAPTTISVPVEIEAISRVGRLAAFYSATAITRSYIGSDGCSVWTVGFDRDGQRTCMRSPLLSRWPAVLGEPEMFELSDLGAAKLDTLLPDRCAELTEEDFEALLEWFGPKAPHTPFTSLWCREASGLDLPRFQPAAWV